MRVALHRDDKEVVIGDFDDTDDPLVSLVITIGILIKLLQFEAANLWCNLKQAEVLPKRTSVIPDVAFLDVRPYRDVAVEHRNLGRQICTRCHFLRIAVTMYGDPCAIAVEVVIYGEKIVSPRVKREVFCITQKHSFNATRSN